MFNRSTALLALALSLVLVGLVALVVTFDHGAGTYCQTTCTPSTYNLETR